MKKYWMAYYNNFGNTYVLLWTDSKEMENKLPWNKEHNNVIRISRKEAIKRARENAKEGTDGYYYASELICPAGGPVDPDCLDYDFNTRIATPRK